MKKRWLVPSIVVGLALMLAAPAWADLQDRFDAYKREVFEADLKELPSSALQGDAEAQGRLGLMYRKGQGVPQDYVLAHMWANLAAAQGHENAIKNRDTAEELMTPAQLAEAQRLAGEWKAKGK